MPRRSLRKHAAKTTLPYERNRKDFHKMLELVAKPDMRTDTATKKRLGLLKASLLSREEKLKAGRGTENKKRGDPIYEVERVLKTRNRSSVDGIEYLVLWKGFRLAESTWEPAENMLNAQELIDEFLTDNPTKPGGIKDRHLGRPAAATVKTISPSKKTPRVLGKKMGITEDNSEEDSLEDNRKADTLA